MNVLVVAAHPDDEVLGCGGTIARLAREEHEIYIAILGEGVTSRFSSRDEADRQLLEDLKVRSRQVGNLLGARDVFLYDLPDNRFDTVALLDVVKIIEGLVESLAPRVVYTHHGGDLNIDHVVTHRAVLTATRPLPGRLTREVYAFEVASSTDWAFQRFEPTFRPDVFMDISATLPLKIQSLSLYETEIRNFPHPRSAEALRDKARHWGTVVGCEAAEAFELIWAIR